MAAPYTQLLGHVTREGTADVALYISPAEYRVVVRDILVNVANATTATLNIYYLAGGVQYLMARTAVQDSQVFHLDLRQVLPPLSELRAYCDASLWTVLITGYELNS